MKTGLELPRSAPFPQAELETLEGDESFIFYIGFSRLLHAADFRQRGARQRWWLATNLDVSLGRLAALYDRRMAIEEQFRDTKRPDSPWSGRN